MDDEQIVKTESRARQGGKGSPVLYVLVASLLLAGLYMVGLMTWSSTQPADRVTSSPESGATTGSTRAPSSSNTSGVPAGNPAYPTPATPSASAPTPAPSQPSTPVKPAQQ